MNVNAIDGHARAALLERYDEAVSRFNTCSVYAPNLTASVDIDRLGNGSFVDNILQLEAFIDDKCQFSFDTFWPLHTRIVMTVIFATLSLIGIVGNLLVILVVFRVRGMVSRTVERVWLVVEKVDRPLCK